MPGVIGGNRPKKLNGATNVLILGSDTRKGANARYAERITRQQAFFGALAKEAIPCGWRDMWDARRGRHVRAGDSLGACASRS